MWNAGVERHSSAAELRFAGLLVVEGEEEVRPVFVEDVAGEDFGCAGVGILVNSDQGDA